MQLKVNEVKRAFDKLKMEQKNTDHKMVWFVHDGKRILHSKLSHGSGDAASPHKIRQQLKLNETQFRDLINCPLTREQYIEILTTKGLIEKSQN